MNKLKEFINGFKNGDNITRLSYFVMGSGSFLRKQFHRGIIFLIAQITGIVYFVMSGFDRIKGLLLLPHL